MHEVLPSYVPNHRAPNSQAYLLYCWSLASRAEVGSVCSPVSALLKAALATGLSSSYCPQRCKNLYPGDGKGL